MKYLNPTLFCKFIGFINISELKHRSIDFYFLLFTSYILRLAPIAFRLSPNYQINTPFCPLWSSIHRIDRFLQED